MARPTKTASKVKVKKEVVTSDDDLKEVEIKKVMKVSKNRSRDGKKTSKKEAVKSPNVEEKSQGKVIEDSDSDVTGAYSHQRHGRAIECIDQHSVGAHV